MGVHRSGSERCGHSWFRIQPPGVTILRFEGDRLVERHSVADLDTVVVQLTAD